LNGPKNRPTILKPKGLQKHLQKYLSQLKPDLAKTQQQQQQQEKEKEEEDDEIQRLQQHREYGQKRLESLQDRFAKEREEDLLLLAQLCQADKQEKERLEAEMKRKKEEERRQAELKQQEAARKEAERAAAAAAAAAKQKQEREQKAAADKAAADKAAADKAAAAAAAASGLGAGAGGVGGGAGKLSPTATANELLAYARSHSLYAPAVAKAVQAGHGGQVTSGLYTSVLAAQKMAAGYQNAKDKIRQLELARQSYEAVVKGPRKNELFKVKLDINRAVNQIGMTAQQIQAKVQQLSQWMVKYQGDTPASNYVLVTIAEKFCAQTPRIGPKPSAAFPIAYVAAILCHKFRPLVDLFLGCLYSKCVFCIPAFPVRESFKSGEEYKIALGYQQTADKAWEPEDTYDERMKAYVSLYAAFVQTQMPAHPHGLGYGWKWIATLLNVTPPLPTAATALTAFLEMSGYMMFKVYKKHFVKLLAVIKNEYHPVLTQVCKSGPPETRATQVGLIIKEFEEKRDLKRPEGQDPPRTQSGDSSHQHIRPGDNHGE